MAALVGPYSRPTALARLDGRSRESRLLKRIREELAQHVGGAPNIAQQMLIERLAVVTLRLSLFDVKLASDQPVTDHDARVYGSLHNAQRLLIREIGVRATSAPQPTLSEYLAAKGAAA